MYEYKAEVVRVIDGDTIVLNIDLGFKVFWKVSCRLHGINCPELHSSNSEERLRANASKEYTVSKALVGSSVLIESVSLDKYGRPLVEVYYGEEFLNHLNDELLVNKLAVPYMV
jgi:micrococcal nuclease